MSSSQHSSPSLRAQLTSQNGEISCSVEETNRIRAALGLRPLRTESSTKSELVVSNTSSQPSVPLRERISKARQARLTRERSVAAHGIAEESHDNEEEDEEEEDGLLAWVNNSRARERLMVEKKLQKRQRVKEDDINVTEEKDDEVVDTLRPTLPKEMPSKSSMYVLADTSVVDGKDVLEDVAKPREHKRSPSIDGAFYDGTDNVEFAEIKSSERGGLSAAVGAMEVDDDYAADLGMEKVFAKRRKERKSFKRRKRGTDTAAATVGRMKELRNHEREQRTRESSDDDALYESLARARRVAKEKEMKRSVDTILQAINRANEIEGSEIDVMEDAEKIVYSEMEQFLQRLPTKNTESDSGDEIFESYVGSPENRAEKSWVVESRIEDIENGNAQDGAMDTKESDQTGSAGSNDESNPLQTNNEEGKEAIAPLDPQLGTDSLLEETKIGGQSGVAAFLQRLRTTGDLKERHAQHGRARDKRFTDDEAEEKEVKKQDEPEIKLRYTDEQGNELTRKEAFRLLCHKFHGNGPGKNKTEKRLRRMLENIKARNMRSDDTPLASAAALKDETQKMGSAHVVLSGAQALRKK